MQLIMARKKDIEVKDSKAVKPELFQIIPLVNIGTLKSGKPRYEAGKSYKVSKEKRDNYKLNKIIK